MEENLHKTIEVSIAGRRFPIKVSTAEEAMAREIEDDLNQKINDFQLKYKDKDKLDCVIMTLLTTAFEQKEKKVDHAQESEINQYLEKLNSLLESNIH